MAPTPKHFGTHLDCFPASGFFHGRAALGKPTFPFMSGKHGRMEDGTSFPDIMYAFLIVVMLDSGQPSNYCKPTLTCVWHQLRRVPLLFPSCSYLLEHCANFQDDDSQWAVMTGRRVCGQALDCGRGMGGMAPYSLVRSWTDRACLRPSMCVFSIQWMGGA